MLRDGTYIRATHLIGLDEIATQSGFEATEFVEYVGIPVEALSNPDMFISFQAMALLIEIAAQKTGRPNLGLEWIENAKPHFHHAGQLKLIAHFVSTCEEWLEVAQRYWKMHTNAFTIELINDNPNHFKIRLKYHSLALPARQFVEASLATVVEMARVVLRRPDESPIHVRFQHEKPKSVELHEKVFRCPIEFGSEYSEVELEKRVLGYSTYGSLKSIQPLMASYVRWRIGRLKIYDQTAATNVTQVVASLMGSGHCKIDVVAASLGLNAKQLQRQLTEEGTNFSEIFEGVRQAAAKRMLIDTEANIERISSILDYASTGPFTTAFKRWTGQTPLKFRQVERKKIG